MNSYKNGFAFFTMLDNASGKKLGIVGRFDSPKVGDEIHLEGLRYGKDEKFKAYRHYICRDTMRIAVDQAQALRYDPSVKSAPVRVAPMSTAQLPVDRVYLKRYLEAMTPGVGPAISEQLVSSFDPNGERNLLDALDAGDPAHVANVCRMTGSIPQVLVNLWKERPKEHRAMIALWSMGLRKNQCKAAMERALGRINIGPTPDGNHFLQAASRIAQHPYRLTMIDGIGFSTADTAARRMGLPTDSDQRIAAAAREAIHEASREGDTMLPLWDLANRVATMLDPEGRPEKPRSKSAAAVTPNPAFDPVRVARVIWSMDASEGLVFPNGKAGAHDIVSTARLADAERFIAESIVDRLSRKPTVEIPPPSLEELTKLAGHDLHPRQAEAIHKALESNVVVITGGPGSGKTTILKTLIAVLKKNNLRIMQGAPTGMAARRQSEATGHPSDTIHRQMGSKGFTNEFLHGPDNPLDLDVLVLDEGSMLETLMTSKVFGAAPAAARIIIVGDHDQLPSVGPGMVLGDLIGSGIPPVARLTFTYRQAKGNPIADLARNIRDGIARLPENADPENLLLMHAKEKGQIARLVIEAVMALRDKGAKPQEMLVLSPKVEGVTGVTQLNLEIQRHLNPDALRYGVAIGGRRQEFSKEDPDLFENQQAPASARMVAGVNDRVMFRKNDKVLGLANGDTGTVLEVGRDRKFLLVDFGFDRPVRIADSSLSSLDLSYACTIHKSQGSECRHVIMALSPEHKFMMRRNLLYTGITRAKHQLVLVGDTEVLLAGVHQVQETQRKTMLQGFLRQAMQSHKEQFTPDEDRIKHEPLPPYRLDLKYAS